MKTILMVMLIFFMVVSTVILAEVAYLIFDDVKNVWENNQHLTKKEGE